MLRDILEVWTLSVMDIRNVTRHPGGLDSLFRSGYISTILFSVSLDNDEIGKTKIGIFLNSLRLSNGCLRTGYHT
jgi:hypothetical protein